MIKALRRAGFKDVAVHHFPQCSYPTGWWSVTMACKDGPITFTRAAVVEGKGLPTQYYNAAIHRASTAAPEFFRQMLHLNSP
jgi:spermidine synthase